jgi:protein-tyrosine phosphatase
MGNICRSPAAEGIMHKKLQDAGLSDQVQLDSAGTLGYHEGSPADQRMLLAARSRGYELKSRARKVQLSDHDTFDLILAMDRSNLSELREDKGSAELALFCSYTLGKLQDVPDPYYGGGSGFEKVLDMLELGCDKLVASLKQRLA